VNKKRKWK